MLYYNHMFDISVDQFIHADGGAQTSSCRKHIDVLLNSMSEKELVVIEATAEGIKKARETEDA
ncbi:XRE family transcriptional regulator [Clostridiaceae bacterium]|nr:XRE family transcriptional regulator [Clostridiaceae bacterium]